MKVIAAICMLVDHIGMVFFPEQIVWRMVGRLAMPIFAYCIARGMLYTSSVSRYLKRLGIFALASQVPFWCLLQAAEGGPFFRLQLNIGFTFWVAAGMIAYGQKEAPSDKTRLARKIGSMGVYGVALVLAEVLNMDYGFYGVLVVIGCYLVLQRGKDHGLLLGMTYTLVTLIAFFGQPGMFLLQEIGVLGMMVVTVMKQVSERRLKKFFYLFYPAHMLLLYGIKLWLEVCRG